jgi:sugar-specific transcriptional regulator TrmB
MVRIDEFLNELYKDSALNPKEVQEMKEEMRTHLMDYIEEAIRRGLTEEQAITEALDHFGEETEIFEDTNIIEQRKIIWGKWFITSTVLLSISILLIFLFWGNEQLNQQDRNVFYKGVRNALYMNESPSIHFVEKEVKQAVKQGVIKDVVITKGTYSSSPVFFRTASTEGFPQDDSYFIETKEERIPLIQSDREETYLLISSFNTIKFGPILFISLLLFVGYLFTFMIWFLKKRK